MTILRIPGLVDAHVHLREPGYEHKEDFYSGTAAALAGGVTTVLDMPNTQPPTATPEQLAAKARLAAAKAVCDVGLFVAATNDLADAYLPAATRACGLKIYVSDTFGSLRIDTLDLMHRLFRTWAERARDVGYRSDGQAGGLGPVAVHAEELMLPVCLNLSRLYDAPLHVVHVSRRSEIELIRVAKERGYRVTCEVTPHHLFLTTDDAARLGPLGDMRPRLATPDDQCALWKNLAVIDVFATDHAPHTQAEKALPEPPPGVPGLETMLPLLLTAVADQRLTLDDIIARCCVNPRRIYGLPEQPETWVEVEILEEPIAWRNEEMHTRVGWSPFAGIPLRARVRSVTLRGAPVYADGTLLAQPGSGHVLFHAAG
ncbi:MAG: amidohydrolase family protein [Caldilineaceae bacterium]|nr:amidohydrolase family protein [Caldilineaceae bacterium]